MCRGDTTLSTLRYDKGNVETEYPLARKCVDVEALLGWAEERAVDLRTDVVSEAETKTEVGAGSEGR
jgi:hypothetical protein